MIRAAAYARYSTELQTDKSIDDQLRICGEEAKRRGLKIIQNYSDAAESGQTLIRSGIQKLLLDAMERKFDVVVSEALDRISRDQADVASVFKKLRFMGIQIITISEGLVDEMHIGLKGTMNALYIKEIRAKTKRGLEGRILEGKSAGGKCYGYDVIRTLDEKGELVSGERAINEDEARIVQRIFGDYLRGKSPKKIAHELNAEGIPGPSGKAWGSSTIYGNRHRGTGILNNELYIGQLVWNKLTYQKHPDTGKRISRLNPESEWKRVEVEHLRIIDQATWQKVKEHQGELDKRPRFQDKKRPPNLFSFLLKCGECGGGMSIVGPRRYGCSTARNKGTCNCRTTISQDVLEEKVIGALRTRLMNPEMTKVFCEEYTAHINRLRMEHNANLIGYRKELAKVEREMENFLQLVAQGTQASFLAEKANSLQARKDELVELLEATEEAPVYVHPNMAMRYAEAIEGLLANLNDPAHRPESAQLIRGLVDKIVLTPNAERTELIVDLYGDLAGILQVSDSRNSTGVSLKPRDRLNTEERKEIEQVESVADSPETGSEPRMVASKVQMVAGVGFEPTTFRL
ncbi:recombinase family protein [Rhodovulum marinum]|uniref:DNA invertase Pin-like site-specific DNA recombinase n=1 Tax=Rhodovulum marinum TaxID=320662 RepID=A0A4R2PSD9_9RHOB|nr:recombinase family protein [Rhodovulum marinum]TCP38769.1 DNA invertase Pin-like site-specific DNA recombinase [Rhodovulum marinum]